MITLLTDFGAADYFVPAVKGVILSINPQAQIVDITHEIAAQEVASGAFTLGACYRNFPSGTIHLAVVDPGVGSQRRALIVKAGDYLFVGPDNGIFGYIYARESRVEVYQISREEYFRRPVSATFHARDIFAPVAAWLSRGVAPQSFGEEFLDYVKLEIPRPVIEGGSGRGSKRIEGKVIHIDRFGNCITNISELELPFSQSAFRMIVGGREVAQSGTHYAQAARKNEAFAYPGSAGYWEIAIWCGSAAKALGVQAGARVIIER